MRTHNKGCECDICWAEDLKDKYPDLLEKFTAKEVSEIWISYSEEMCASWLYDDREAVFQVFYQAPRFIKSGKPENYHWHTGRFFNIKEIDKLLIKE